MRHYAQSYESLSQLSISFPLCELLELSKSLVAGPTSPKHRANLIVNTSMNCNSWFRALINNGLRRLKGEV